MFCTPCRAPARRNRSMAGKVGCALLLAVLLLGVFRAGYIPSGFIYTQF